MDPKKEMWSAIDGAWHMLNLLHKDWDKGYMDHDELAKYTDPTALIQALDTLQDALENLPFDEMAI